MDFVLGYPYLRAKQRRRSCPLLLIWHHDYSSKTQNMLQNQQISFWEAPAIHHLWLSLETAYLRHEKNNTQCVLLKNEMKILPSNSGLESHLYQSLGVYKAFVYVSLVVLVFHSPPSVVLPTAKI